MKNLTLKNPLIIALLITALGAGLNFIVSKIIFAGFGITSSSTAGLGLVTVFLVAAIYTYIYKETLSRITRLKVAMILLVIQIVIFILLLPYILSLINASAIHMLVLLLCLLPIAAINFMLVYFMLGVGSRTIGRDYSVNQESKDSINKSFIIKFSSYSLIAISLATITIMVLVSTGIWSESIVIENDGETVIEINNILADFEKDLLLFFNDFNSTIFIEDPVQRESAFDDLDNQIANLNTKAALFSSLIDASGADLTSEEGILVKNKAKDLISLVVRQLNNEWKTILVSERAKDCCFAEGLTDENYLLTKPIERDRQKLVDEYQKALEYFVEE